MRYTGQVIAYPVDMKWWMQLFGRRRLAANTDFGADSLRRQLLPAANDGIISSAAIIQGLLAGGASGHDALVGVAALIAIGIVSTAAAEYSELTVERDAQLSLVRAEARQLEESPEEEFNELVAAYRKKGLSEELSRSVAEELTASNALAAQLESEYGIGEVIPASWPWRFGALAGTAFLLGSVIPLILLTVLPWSTRGEVTLVVLVLTLAISGWIGANSAYSSPLRSMIRTVMVGVVTLGFSALAGTLVNF